MHGISEQQWVDYLDRNLDGAETARIKAHLGACAECRKQHEGMLRTVRSLETAAARVRDFFPVEQERTHVALAHVLARVLDAEAKEQKLTGDEIRVRLEQLEEILTDLCGSWTAANALRVAARTTIDDSLGKLNRANWLSFLKRLTSIASVFCGDTGARLVWECGQL